MTFVEIISSREDFSGLEPEWNALLRRSAADTLALTHQWLLTWWDVFGAGRELHILVVRDENEVIGIAPLLKRRVLNLGLPYQRLEFLASGEDEADEICSDYLDFILLQGREAEALAAMLDFLESENGWDEMLLRELPAASPTVPLLEQLNAVANLKCEITPDGESVYLPLPDDWEEMLSSFPRRVRSKARRDCERALQPDCSLRIFDDAADFEEGFETLVQLHQQLWNSRGEPGVFASKKFLQFHRELAPRLLSEKQASVYILNFCGEPLTSMYTFFYKDKAFLYQSGFKEGGPFHSPGTTIRNLAVQDAIARGCTEWDFMKAVPGSYKYRWSQHVRPLVQVRIARTQLKEAVYTSSHRVVDGLRQVKRSFKRCLV